MRSFPFKLVQGRLHASPPVLLVTLSQADSLGQTMSHFQANPSMLMNSLWAQCTACSPRLQG